MAKQINFTYNGEDYTLEYSRATCKALEQRGFSLNKLQDQGMTMIPVLWEGAFLMHHKRAKQETINAIFSRMKNKEDLLLKLVELYNEPYNTLLEEPTEEKELEWEVRG